MPEESFTDIQLIKDVKSNNDSKALEELINRHTGIYYDIVNRYSFIPELEKHDLMDNKMFNIYSYIIDYKDDKNTKLSTYIANRTKYECLSLLTHKIEKEEIDENLVDKSSTKFDHEFLDILVREAKKIEDERFYQIIEMKYLSKPALTFKAIGVKMGISRERVRQIFDKNIQILRKRLKDDIKEQL